MAKQKKKRTKRYHGEDAATQTTTQPVVHRIKAVDRGPVGQWWHEKKKAVKITGIISSVVLFITWLIVELFRIVS